MNPMPEKGEATPQTATVLVATSDSATRDLLRRILHVGAINIVDASDGVEALALARRLDLDLILIDTYLSVLDGISVCERIRALPEIDPPPIIVIGLSSERAVEVALASGAEETISRPLNPVLIRHRTRMMLKRRRNERHLSLMQRAIENAPAGMTILDARSSEYNVSFANPAFLKMTGHAADDILGCNLRVLRGPDTDVAAMTELRDAFCAGRDCRVLIKNYRKDGSSFWNDLATAPIHDASDRLTHFIAVQHDVTSIVQAPEHASEQAIKDAVVERTRELDSALASVEERRRFTETILNAMVSAILVTDAKGSVTFANRAALHTLGTSLADCVGRSVVEIFGHNEGVSDVILGKSPSHLEYRLDFPFISPGGARFYVGMSITRTPEEFRKEIGFIFLFRNLAETIEDERDPRLQKLDRAEGVGAIAAAESAATADTQATAAKEALARDETLQRRIQTSLCDCSPVDLIHAAWDTVAQQQENRATTIRIEDISDCPAVTVDKQQIIEALSILIASAIHLSGDPEQVHVKFNAPQSQGDKSAQRRSSVRIDILYPRPIITDHDIGSEPTTSTRQTYRSADLLSAEKLIDANGGRLTRPVCEGDEQTLSVQLPAAKANETEPPA